jgi:DNA-binding response OmpR family regulator
MYDDNSVQLFRPKNLMISLLGKRILLVEDEMLLAMLFEDMLTDMGMTVVGPFREVSTTLNALETTGVIDIALLDVDLGSATSLSVANALVERNVPFMFATGFGSREIKGHADIPVLGKPFTEEQLMASIRLLLYCQ